MKNCAGETLLRARADAELEIGAGNGGVNIVGEGGAAFPDGVATSKITAPPTENLEISSRTNRVDIFGARGVEIIGFCTLVFLIIVITVVIICDCCRGGLMMSS